MIYPGVITYTQRPYDLRVRAAIPVIQLPIKTKSGDADRGIVDQIRSMPKLNDIDVYSESLFKDDIIQLIKLLGSYCKVDPINEIIDNINLIHGTFNNKEAPEIKNWILKMTFPYVISGEWTKVSLISCGKTAPASYTAHINSIIEKSYF
jgi:hypothetical protein